jgi:CBS domain-containing protein
MAIEYNIIEIFTDEEARYKGKPLYKAIVDLVKDLKIIARCVVFKGTEAYYETGEMAMQDILIISYNLPIKIEILLPSTELDKVMNALEIMIDSGICSVRKVDILFHRIRKSIIPKHVRVKDIMVPHPDTIPVSTKLDYVVKKLLSSIFTGMPVIDEEGHPVGIITQSDLIYKANMPIKLSILPDKDREKLNEFLVKLSQFKTEDVMNKPAITINQEKMLFDAISMMNENNVKRLPVVNDRHVIVGMLSRMDIFHVITKEFPDWKAFREKKIILSSPKVVSDVMRSDTLTVTPTTSAEEVINIVNINDLEAVAVVRDDGLLRGLIFEHDLLKLFSYHEVSIWSYLRNKLSGKKDEPDLMLFFKNIRKKTASDLMKTDLVTILENTGIDEAIALITNNEIKRLPVVDQNGNFKGLINRESLLRAAISHES